MRGKKPTRKQKILIRYYRLNPDNWLVIRNTDRELHIIHRHTDNIRVLPKRDNYEN